MQHRPCHFWQTAIIALICGSLNACSSGNSTPDATPAADEPVNTAQPPDFQLDAPALVLGPEISVIVRPETTDLVVAYSDEALQESVSVDYVVSEWESMKLCLDASIQAPYVVIVDGFLDSVPSDDVIFNFAGRRLASATWNRDSVNVTRVSRFDFDGSQGNPGFHLRSIFGRYIWTLSERPVRDYNIGCASGN